jgi:hypothetical protein
VAERQDSVNLFCDRSIVEVLDESVLEEEAREYEAPKALHVRLDPDCG